MLCDPSPAVSVVELMSCRDFYLRKAGLLLNLSLSTPLATWRKIWHRSSGVSDALDPQDIRTDLTEYRRLGRCPLCTVGLGRK